MKLLAWIKCGELVAYIETAPLSVLVLDADELLRQAIEHWNYEQIRRASQAGHPRGVPPQHAGPDSDPLFLERLQVNYLRHHEQCEYDLLAGTARDLGCQHAGNVLRDRVFEIIAKAYPFLSAECERQQERQKQMRSSS